MWVLGALLPVILPIPARIGFVIVSGTAGFAAVSYWLGKDPAPNTEVARRRAAAASAKATQSVRQRTPSAHLGGAKVEQLHQHHLIPQGWFPARRPITQPARTLAWQSTSNQPPNCRSTNRLSPTPNPYRPFESIPRTKSPTEEPTNNCRSGANQSETASNREARARPLGDAEGGSPTVAAVCRTRMLPRCCSGLPAQAPQFVVGDDPRGVYVGLDSLGRRSDPQATPERSRTSLRSPGTRS